MPSIVLFGGNCQCLFTFQPVPESCAVCEEPPKFGNLESHFLLEHSEMKIRVSLSLYILTLGLDGFLPYFFDFQDIFKLRYSFLSKNEL